MNWCEPCPFEGGFLNIFTTHGRSGRAAHKRSPRCASRHWGTVSTVLDDWNRPSVEQAIGAILPCCGSQAWARGMAVRRPLVDEASLLAASDETWHNLTQSDWMEAFQSHPRIGESNARQFAPSQAAAWSAHEQKRIADAETAVKIALEEGN